MSNPKLAWLKGPSLTKRSTVNASSSSSAPNSSAGGKPANGIANNAPSPLIYGGGVKDTTGKTAEYSSMDDECPVCKTDRYLNPKLRLLVSSCYHKMCESCIDRLFTLGPQPCPICGKTLRKMAFTPQTFEDLVVEKEVAVRRRIAKEFNKRREDFPDLRSYNDYLEEVEDITFNLLTNTNVAETEQRIARFRAENAALIELNIQREQQDVNLLLEEEEREREERAEMEKSVRDEEEREREVKMREKEDIINKLETSSTPAARLIAQSRAKTQSLRRTHPKALPSPTSLARARYPATITVPDTPHVPLTDSFYSYSDKYALHPNLNYDDPVTEQIRADRNSVYRAGGYRVDEVWERALRCAVAGLDIRPLGEIPATSSIVDESGDVLMSSA